MPLGHGGAEPKEVVEWLSSWRRRDPVMAAPMTGLPAGRTSWLFVRAVNLTMTALCTAFLLPCRQFSAAFGIASEGFGFPFTHTRDLLARRDFFEQTLSRIVAPNRNRGVGDGQAAYGIAGGAH